MTRFLRFCMLTSAILTALAAEALAADGPELETTKIEPHLTYRTVSILGQNKDSIFYQGETAHDYFDQIYARVRMEKIFNFNHEVIIEPTIRTSRDKPEEMELIFEQAYIYTEVAPNLFLTGGKKTEFDGTGFFISPSDLLNEDKDLFDTLYQYEGKVFSRLTYQHDGRSLGVGFIPQRGQEGGAGRIWTKATAEVAEIDIRVQHTYHRQELNTLGLSMSRFFGDHLELHWDGRYQQRQRQDTGIYRERPFSASYPFEASSGYYLAGLRYVVATRKTLIIEGIQNQSGLDSHELSGDSDDPVQRTTYYSYNKKERADGSPKNPEPRIIGRRYAFFGFKDESTFASVKLGFYALTNIVDASSYGQASILYNISPLTSIELQPIWFAGHKRSEFGERPTNRLIALNLRGKF